MTTTTYNPTYGEEWHYLDVFQQDCNELPSQCTHTTHTGEAYSYEHRAVQPKHIVDIENVHIEGKTWNNTKDVLLKTRLSVVNSGLNKVHEKPSGHIEIYYSKLPLESLITQIAMI
jgi:hypothetical protein